MVTKEPKTTSKEFREELQGQGLWVSDHTIGHWANGDLMEDDQGGHHCWKQITRKWDIVWQNACKQARKLLEEYSLETKLEIFGNKTPQLFVHKEKNTVGETWRLILVLGLLSCIWQGVRYLYMQGAIQFQDYQGILEQNVPSMIRKSGLSCRSWDGQQDNDSNY